jgi:hypothetical protein
MTFHKYLLRIYHVPHARLECKTGTISALHRVHSLVGDADVE